MFLPSCILTSCKIFEEVLRLVKASESEHLMERGRPCHHRHTASKVGRFSRCILHSIAATSTTQERAQARCWQGRRHCHHRHYSAAYQKKSDQPCCLYLCDGCCNHHSSEREALGLGGSASKHEGMGLPLSLVKPRPRSSSSTYLDSSSGKSSTSDCLCVCIIPFLSSKE